ncbi:MAG: GntR family transcriptional regulator [Clostridia bacterium]|nr:GntR family transcriptional regulator [Clostridia bacterium]
MLELLGKQDVYIEVAEKYKQYILCGIYNVGDRLPSVRMVGTELGVNPNTVAKAYSLLEKDGYIKALPKKGVYVIYESKNSERNKKIYQAKAVLEDLKKQGLSYVELTELIKEVWDEND